VEAADEINLNAEVSIACMTAAAILVLAEKIIVDTTVAV
jgi:hypothetical protein